MGGVGFWGSGAVDFSKCFGEGFRRAARRRLQRSG